MRKSIVWVLLGLSVLLFLGAMATPALAFEKLCAMGKIPPAGLFQAPVGVIEAWIGVKILLLGIIGMIFMPHLSFGWLANPIYAVAFVSLILHRSILAALLAIASIIIGVSGTLWVETHGLPADEGGVCYLYLNQLNPGFWMWIAAQGMILLAVPIQGRR